MAMPEGARLMPDGSVQGPNFYQPPQQGDLDRAAASGLQGWSTSTPLQTPAPLMAPRSNVMPKQTAQAAAPAAPVPQYSDVIQQLMGAAPPSSMGLFGNNPTKAFGAMTDAANQANYGRGGAILDLLSKQGGSSKADNADLFDQEQGSIDQDMMAKGLSNLTVGDTLKAGATRDLARANNRVDENVAGNMANMAASFQQKAPDLSMLANLIGQGGGGGFGGGGGTGAGGWNHGGAAAGNSQFWGYRPM